MSWVREIVGAGFLFNAAVFAALWLRRGVSDMWFPTVLCAVLAIAVFA
jgi:hypothetical protein